MQYFCMLIGTFVLCILSACSHLSTGSSLKTLRMTADDQLNQGHSLFVDSVWCYTEDAWKKFRDMPSSVYFRQTSDLKHTFMEDIAIIRHEIFPSMNVVYAPRVPYQFTVHGCRIFARYQIQSGSHAINIPTSIEAAHLRLGRVSIDSLGKDKSSPTRDRAIAVYPMGTSPITRAIEALL